MYPSDHIDPSIPQSFKFTKGSVEDLTSYSYGKKSYGHKFCPVCGAPVVGQRLSDGEFGVNLRCVEGVDLTTLNPIKLDGASM